MKKEWQEKKNHLRQWTSGSWREIFCRWSWRRQKKIEVGAGLYVIQSFEPIPLYSALSDLGFEYLTEKISDDEYRVYFHRTEEKEPTLPGGMNVPLKPTAILNFKEIDNELANIVVPFWKLIWEKEKPAIDQKTRYLLSLANGVGGGRYRQATREMVKEYAIGLTVEELDELFSGYIRTSQLTKTP